MMPNQYQTGKEWNAFWESSWIEMKVYATNKKCKSSVLPSQLQAGVPKSRISMWRVFKSWTLFITIKFKRRQLVHEEVYYFIPLDVLSKKRMNTQIKWSIAGPWGLLAHDLTEVILFPDDIGFSSVYRKWWQHSIFTDWLHPTALPTTRTNPTACLAGEGCALLSCKLLTSILFCFLTIVELMHLWPWATIDRGHW